MKKCPFCKKEFSQSVLKIHKTWCKENQEKIEQQNEENQEFKKICLTANKLKIEFDKENITIEELKEAIEKETDLILAVYKGKSGWYTFNEGEESEEKIQGEEKALEYYLENIAE